MAVVHGLSSSRAAGSTSLSSRHRKFVGGNWLPPGSTSWAFRPEPFVAGRAGAARRRGLPSRSWCAQCSVGRRVADTSRTTITTGAPRAADSSVVAHVRNRGPARRLRAAPQRHRDHFRLEVHRQRPRRPPSPRRRSR